MNEIIPYGKQELTEQDITSVVNVLKSDYWTQGPVIGEFEKLLPNMLIQNMQLLWQMEQPHCISVPWL